jgi:Transglutaminase-like superfamily
MRRYATPPLSWPQVELSLIPKGYLGTQTTLDHIQDLIRAGAKDFYVRQKAIDILLEKAIKPKNYLGEIKALFEWMQQNVRYTKDPFRVEVLHSARRLLELRAGDCDDMTILLGSMLESIGHPVRLIVTGPNPLRPKLFSHIYLEAFHQGQWIPLDATMPYAMGWEPRTVVKQVIPIERRTERTTERRTNMMQQPELQGFAAMTSLPSWLPSLIQTVQQGGLKPKDPRVKSLWILLKQRQLLHRSRWLNKTLGFIWKQGLSARPRPNRARRIERLMQKWGILPGIPASTTRGSIQPMSAQPSAQTKPAIPSRYVAPLTQPQSVPSRAVPEKPLQVRPLQPVTIRPVPGVMVKPIAQVKGK